MPMIEYTKTDSMTKFDNNCSQEFFSEFCHIVKKYEGNEEVYHCLMSLLNMIIYRGISADLYSSNQYHPQVTKSGIETELSLNVKKIVEEREKDEKKMDERKEEIVFAYSLLMKWTSIESSLLLPLANILLGILERGVKEGEKGETEMKAALALRCIVEHHRLLFF
jgi:hypothetical protein